MSRLNINEIDTPATTDLTDFGKLILEYAENKAESDYYDKICKEQNEQIKNYLHTNKITGGTYGDYTVTLKILDKSTMNQERLLKFCKKHNITGCIRTQEYVDENILETLIYDGKIDSDIIALMDSCRDAKFQENLYVKKSKKNKEDN